MSLLPGTVLGVYTVKTLVGQGGMGDVYRAHDSHLGRDVALKTLPQAFAADPDRVARFEREARILATLNHPNIATLYGFERHGGVLALVMEMVEGETLQDHLKHAHAGGGRLPLPEIIGIAKQIVDALDAAHERGVVHRDLKPANIKLTPDGLVKVLDFGLAKAVAGDPEEAETRSLPAAGTHPHVVLGTAAYMSPEQARGQPLDRRTDIWSFGCVLYEMLSGQPAFARSTSSDTIAAVLTGEADRTALPPNLPRPMRHLVETCLERSMKARLRDIADARLFLDEAAGPMSAVSDTDASKSASRPAGVSRRTLLASGAALGLLGAGLGSAFAWRKRDPVTMPSFQRLTFRRGMIRTARFGPDFQTVLYGALWDGDVCRVYTVRPDSPNSSAVSLPPAMPLAVSSGGELALALGSHLREAMPYGTLARVPLVGGAPRELQEQVKYADWTPDGRELAIVRGADNRDVLEFPSGKPIAEPAAPGGFSFPRVSPRGDAVAVFELESATGLTGKVVVFDRTGARRVESAQYFNVFGLAWHKDEVWFTAADELPLFRNAVHAMDAAGAVRVAARIAGNASLHDVAPDGRVLIAHTDDRGGVTVRAPGAEERDMAWLDSPYIVAMSRDGRTMLFWEGGVGGGPRGSVYLRGTDGSSAVRLGDGRPLALSPDGQWVIARTEEPHLDLLPTGAGSPRRLERAGLRLFNAKWLPDSRRALVQGRTGQAALRLYLVDVQGTATTPITPEALSIGFSGWAVSPDGALVAVSTPNGPELFPLAGGASRRVPSQSKAWTVVGWIESGLLVSEQPRASGTVFKMDPETGRHEQWAEFRPQDPAGIMNMNLALLVTTPDGAGYGYNWHRATSDLYLVRGWS